MGDGKREAVAYAITHAPRGQRGGPYEGSGAYGFPAGSLRTAFRWYNGARPAEYTMQSVRAVVPTARVIRIVRKAPRPHADLSCPIHDCHDVAGLCRTVEQAWDALAKAGYRDREGVRIHEAIRGIIGELVVTRGERDQALRHLAELSDCVRRGGQVVKS